jgi:histidinol-phosphate aminotransferase
MAAYALAQRGGDKGRPIVSLSQNESLRPPSPVAIAAGTVAMNAGHLYPDPDWRDLRRGLAAVHGIPEDGILCANGSMDLIAALAAAFADETRAVLAPAHAYPYFRTAAQLARARLDTAPEPDRVVSVEALLDAVRPDTALVFVANPGNPTGTRIPRAALVTLREQLPDNILLVVDEAYGEFADHLGEPMFDLVARSDTVVLRTFSKAYGIAGARVGWGVFPPAVACELRKVMAPNNISAAGQAMAAAALSDQAYMLETCALTTKRRDTFRARLLSAGYEVAESHTNFVLIPFGSPNRAAAADTALREAGIVLRAQGGAGLPDCLRATIGSEEALDTAASVLEHLARSDSK